MLLLVIKYQKKLNLLLSANLKLLNRIKSQKMGLIFSFSLHCCTSGLMKCLLLIDGLEKYDYTAPFAAHFTLTMVNFELEKVTEDGQS